MAKAPNDDFLAKKRESGPILDLSKLSVTNKDEFRKLMDRVPDFRMKAERVRPEEIRLRERRFTWHTAPNRQRKKQETFTFADPLPVEMRSLNVRELAAVPIDWRMLTTLRPKAHIDQLYYSRLVELAKLEQKTQARERRTIITHPQVRKMKNRAGIVEMRPINCLDCGEDFCTGEICCQTNFDQFARLPPNTAAPSVTLKAKDLSILDKHGVKKKKLTKQNSKGGDKKKKKKIKKKKTTTKKIKKS